MLYPYRVTFSRCLFAQTQLQRFFAPKRFQEVLSNQSTNQIKINQNDQRYLKAYDLGVKICCGFEMIYQQNLRNKSRTGSMEMDEDVAKEIDDILDIRDVDEAATPITSFTFESFEKDDSENWLNISQKELDEFLVEKYSNKKNSGTNSSTLKELAKDFTQFVNTKSGIEGVTSQYEESGDEQEDEEQHFNEEDEQQLSDEEEDEGVGSGDENDADKQLQKVMSEMDKEMKQFENIAQDFDTTEEGDEEFNEEFNLVQNFLNSQQVGQGNSGPFGNLMKYINDEKRKSQASKKGKLKNQ